MRYFKIGMIHDLGCVKNTNQDRIIVKVGEEEEGEFALFAVADGMGGMAFGEEASKIAIVCIKKWWENSLFPLLLLPFERGISEIEVQLENLIHQINTEIFDYGKLMNKKGGTTLSLLLIYRDRYIIKNCGDSRIYSFSDKILPLTEDDSWVSEQVRQGFLSKEEARVHPKKNILTKCLGVFENISITENKGKIKGNEAFMLSSDGLHNCFREQELEGILQRIKQNSAEEVQLMADEMLKKVYLSGAEDNISLILIGQKMDV